MGRRRLAPFVLALACLCTAAQAQQLVLQVGANVPASVAARMAVHLRGAWPSEFVELDPSVNVTSAPAGSIVVSVGKTSTRDALLTADELAQLDAEAFVLRSSRSRIPGATLLVADGNEQGKPEYRFDSVGAAYGAYALLEELGFAFLHPLEPLAPATIRIPSQDLDMVESPYWHYRNWHLHTMHPLELTDVVNGFDISHEGYRESFEELLGDWDLFLEWAVASRLNKVEWILLLGQDWLEFGKSSERQARIRTLVEHCHGFGLVCGVDVPIGLVQQNSWAMVGRMEGDPIATMHANIDWWMAAGVDFLTTESGFSEFTQGSCTDMLAWMNEATIYTAEQHNKSMHIKVHISTGQTCDEFPDPETGEPINFNFLPIFADARLGILPHTVQLYTFDDPAPTYGNENFNHMFDFMFREMVRGEREVVFYPETSYWVNYDTQVPLFLPLYAYNRFKDLRLIRRRELELGARIAGQLTFDSGWEWTYWLQDVVTARAQWDPRPEITDDRAAFEALVANALRIFGNASVPMAAWIADVCAAEKDLLVDGNVSGTPPADVRKLNGIAYLEGWDTFADIGMAFSSFLNTQPDRVNPIDFRREEVVEPDYSTLVKPLLAAMEQRFGDLADRLAPVRELVAPEALGLFSEFSDAIEALALRAHFLHAVYDFAATHEDGATPGRLARLRTAEQAIASVEAVVRAREGAYRTPLDRITGWRPNPTVYRYTYLWQVKSLYYYWRDLAKAKAASVAAYSPCFMNVIDPAVVAFGNGTLQQYLEDLREWADDRRPGSHFLIDCVAAPAEEPTYPLAD